MKQEFKGAAQLTHIALHVKDVQKSAAFYKKWCGMEIAHQRDTSDDDQVIWMASPGKEKDFVIVLVPGGKGIDPRAEGVRHLGFALPEVAGVEKMAKDGRKAGILHWDVMDMEYPTGTLCAIKDPDGHVVEFSYGQPLGPGAELAPEKGKKAKLQDRKPFEPK